MCITIVGPSTGVYTETLESIPQIEEWDASREKLGWTILNMQKTGFHHWGFVIYRGAYGDDAKWQRYLDSMRNQIQLALEYDGRDVLLPQYLEWTVIEDKEKLEGATKAQVRSLHAAWAAAIDLTRYAPPVDDVPRLYRPVERFPRFKYCIYVDQDCLDTLDAWEEWDRIPVEPGLTKIAVSVVKGPHPSVVCALIDVACPPEGKGKDGYASLEGYTKEYPGWIYTDVDTIPGHYDELHNQSLYRNLGGYGRPPLVYPRHNRGSSMPHPQ